MAKRPEERFQHPAALEFELLSIAEEEGFDVAVSRATVEPNVSARNAADVSYWPWVFAVAGLVSLVWWTAMAFPVRVSIEKQAAGINYQIQDFGDTPVVRVVQQPSQDNEFDTVAAAVAHLTAGGVIELSGDSEYEIGPTRLGTDIHVTIRGESERRPLLRINYPSQSTFGLEESVFLIEGGHLTLKGLDVRIGHEDVDNIAGYTSIFELTNGAQLTCANIEVSSAPVAVQKSSEESDALVLARVRTSRRSQQEDTDYSTKAIELLSVVSDETGGSPEESSIKIENSVVKGNMTCFVCESSTEMSLSWTGGGVTVDQRFLTVRSSSTRSFEPAKVQLRLRDATFACQNGFTRLEDAPGQDDVPQLRVIVDRCRFIIPESVVLLEQVGVAEPEVYQRAINWTDNRGRYEGGSIFRKIDGAGNAIEIDYSSAGQPLDYQDFPGVQGPLSTN